MNRSRREELELRLAEGGAEALEHDAELREWVESDDEALALFEAMVVLDQSFDAMAGEEMADAPDELVAALLARPALTEPAGSESLAEEASRGFRLSWPRLRRPARIGWRLQLAVAVAAILVVTSSYLVTDLGVSEAPSEPDDLPAMQKQVPESEEEQRDEIGQRRATLQRELRSLGYVGGEGAEGADRSDDSGAVEDQFAEQIAERIAGQDAAQIRQMEPRQARDRSLDSLSFGDAPGKREERSESEAKRDEEPIRVTSENALLDSSQIAEGSAVGARRRNDGSPAARFLAERRRTAGLVFQDAAGYWRNPWLPGDPELRFLAARMDELAPSLPAGLHDLARRPAPPFDPPADGALALHLHADRTVTDGPTRVALRVGVRAADAWAGRRTAMSLAVVLHLPPLGEELPVETAASLRALLEALADAHDLGDRFHIVVAGRPGGVLVPADEFRRGAVVVAARNLLRAGADDSDDGDDGVHDVGPAREIFGLETALRVAGERVRPGTEGEDDSPVGSSAVLVVTTGPDAEALSAISPEAHRLAVAGVRVSALGVGPGASTGQVPDALARLADAGQGSRRLVASGADALPAIEDELAQAARAVARAVRLRIRPASGVRLVGVFDSEPLSAPAADRVREAEQALDQRLAHKLGIEPDRGDDEEGIQIVVPALYAGDAMTLLVDLVATGPGPLADVTVRYKDLVRMDNGVARARLDLAYGEPPATPSAPLEVSVLKSVLAHEVKDCLEKAASRLERANGPALQDAGNVLGTCRDLLRGMAREVPSLAGDADLERDLRMLGSYLSALAADSSAESVSAVRQSLRFAGKLKTLPPPESTEPSLD